MSKSKESKQYTPTLKVQWKLILNKHNSLLKSSPISIRRVCNEQPINCKISRPQVAHLIPRGLSGRKFMVTSVWRERERERERYLIADNLRSRSEEKSGSRGANKAVVSVERASGRSNLFKDLVPRIPTVIRIEEARAGFFVRRWSCWPASWTLRNRRVPPLSRLPPSL